MPHEKAKPFLRFSELIYSVTSTPGSSFVPSCINPELRFLAQLLSSSISTKKKKITQSTQEYNRGFLGGAVVKNLPANARDTGSSPGPGRSHMPQSN